MAVDMFLKIDGIKGESHDHKHGGEIDIESFSWGMSQTGSFGGGGGGGTGKVAFHYLSVVKKLDTASTALMLHCASGKHVPKAILTVRKAGDKPLEYLKITMEDLLVSSVQASGSEGGETPMESLSLNFAKVKVEYTEQDAKGAAKAPVLFGWDVKANQKV
jgi:type VI secretion system secreted protein Hcp